jgi:hypothetical protein
MISHLFSTFGLELFKAKGEQKQVIYIKGLVFDDDEAVELEYALAATKEEVVNTLSSLAAEIVSNGTEGELYLLL